MLKQPNLSHLYNRVRTLSASLAARLRGLAITAAAGLLCTLAVANPPCPSDLDGDGMVTGADISLVLLDFGACSVGSVDPPSISAVSPAFGPTAGGTTITITGTALTDTSSVTVRGNTATSVVVVNDTTVTAVTPPGSVGAANVQVTTPGGTTATSAADQFTYVPAPTVTSVSPASGSSIGGTTVTLPEITPLLPGQDVTITTRVEGVPALFFMKAEVSIEPKTFSSVGETPAARGVASFLAVPVTVLLLLLLAFVATMLVRAVRRHRRLDDQPSDTGVPPPPVDRTNQPQLQ
jgi:hypothetical protein